LRHNFDGLGSYRSKKSITLPRQGLNIKRALDVVIQDGPYLVDAFVDASIEIHKRLISPELLLDLVTGNDLSRVAGQHLQQLEGLG
jgi:hypothetical protein